MGSLYPTPACVRLRPQPGWCRAGTRLRQSPASAPAASSAPELAPPAAAFLEVGRSVEGFAKLDPNAEDPSEAQSQTVDRTAMVTAWNRRYGDWYKKNNL